MKIPVSDFLVFLDSVVGLIFLCSVIIGFYFFFKDTIYKHFKDNQKQEESCKFDDTDKKPM